MGNGFGSGQVQWCIRRDADATGLFSRHSAAGEEQVGEGQGACAGGRGFWL